MVSIVSLWLPILLSAVAVFIISSIIHMVLKYHQNDFIKVPDEDKVMDALRDFKIPPGEYMMPHADDMKEYGTTEFIEKIKNGPCAMMTIMENKPDNMVKSLLLWFVYSIVISIFAAYISSRAVGAETYYLEVFRFTGATAFIGYTAGLWQNSIWFKRSWITTIKNTIDGLIYALVTAGVFGWLWPV